MNLSHDHKNNSGALKGCFWIFSLSTLVISIEQGGQGPNPPSSWPNFPGSHSFFLGFLPLRPFQSQNIIIVAGTEPNLFPFVDVFCAIFTQNNSNSISNLHSLMRTCLCQTFMLSLRYFLLLNVLQNLSLSDNFLIFICLIFCSWWWSNQLHWKRTLCVSWNI